MNETQLNRFGEITEKQIFWSRGNKLSKLLRDGMIVQLCSKRLFEEKKNEKTQHKTIFPNIVATSTGLYQNSK